MMWKHYFDHDDYYGNLYEIILLYCNLSLNQCNSFQFILFCMIFFYKSYQFVDISIFAGKWVIQNNILLNENILTSHHFLLYYVQCT